MRRCQLDAALLASLAITAERELAGTSEGLVGVETQRAVGLQASHDVIGDIRKQNL
jgi:hypothetical protein